MGKNANLSQVYASSFVGISREIDERRKNKRLMKKVEEFFGSNMPIFFGNKPRAVLSRSIATPNMEFDRFLVLSGKLGLNQLILEYPDKFVAKNLNKYHLCKLFFFGKTRKKSSILVDTFKIINFNKMEGKNFSDIKTTWRESITDVHHRFLFSAFPKLTDKVVDFSKWFNHTKTQSEYYYLFFLSLFICHGVLFENFLPNDREESDFIDKKFLPSFKEAERIFGVKPLIYQLLPKNHEDDIYWYSYPDSIKQDLTLQMNIERGII